MGQERKAKPDATITPRLASGNVFGGQETEYRLKVESSRPIQGRAIWRFAGGTATVAAGEAKLDVIPGKAASVTFKFQAPPVKEGVVLHTRLTVSAVDGGRKTVAVHDQDVWVFPKDPFASRTEWLKKLKIGLYDPAGATAKLLTASNVPFDLARDIDILGARQDGLVIVGEGVSFREERGLAAVLERLAASGVPVLCLAPADGELAIPGIGGPAAHQRELSFHRDIARRLDKRFDLQGGDPTARTVASTIAVKPVEGSAVGVVLPDGGWPWVETRNGSGEGLWAVCGLALVGRWEDGPAPRYLFVRMLEYLTQSDPARTGLDQPKSGDK
jgi:hypothetical protein